MLDGAFSPNGAGAFSPALGCALAAVCVAVWSALRGGRLPEQSSALWLRCGSGAVLLSGVAFPALAAGRVLGGVAATLALALTPVVVGVGSAAAAAASSQEEAPLWPSLAGLAGLLLLLPLPTLQSPRYDLGLALVPLVMAGSAWFAFAARTPGPAPDASAEAATPPYLALQLLGGAVLLAALACCQWNSRPTRLFSVVPAALDGVLAALDGVLATLTLLSLARLGPQRWSSQVFWIPLVTALEGAALLHVPLQARSLCSLALIVVAASALVRPSQRPLESQCRYEKTSD